MRETRRGCFDLTLWTPRSPASPACRARPLPSGGNLQPVVVGGPVEADEAVVVHLLLRQEDLVGVRRRRTGPWVDPAACL